MGMGIELSLVLGVMGTVWTGSAFSLTPGFSIGGSATGDGSENVLGNLFGVLGMFVFHPSCPVLVRCKIFTASQEEPVVSKVPTTGLSLMRLSLVTTFM
jgi:hypothetical protein